jgi:hypothetical protein
MEKVRRYFWRAYTVNARRVNQDRKHGIKRR